MPKLRSEKRSEKRSSNVTLKLQGHSQTHPYHVQDTTRKNNSQAEHSMYNEPMNNIKQLEDYKQRMYKTLDLKQQYALDKAIEYEKATQSKEFVKFSTLKKKIDYLESIKTQKKFYLHTIFDKFVDKDDIDIHLNTLAAWKKSTLGKKSLHDTIIHYITYCKEQQEKITAKLRTEVSLLEVGEFLARRYERLTTPLYYDLLYNLDETQLTDTEKIMRSEFKEHIESNNNDVYHVFSEDLDLILDIHTGIWRQLFSDGHKLARMSMYRKTIETYGKQNATANETVLPMKNGKYVCPGCVEKELGTEVDGTFVKNPGVKMAVDHCTPVKQAFLTYEDAGLCAQLTMTCSVCNGVKLDERAEEYIYKIHHDKRPVSMFKTNSKTHLSPGDFELRKKHYVKIHTAAICKGVRTFRDAFKSAAIMKETFTTIKAFEEAQVMLVLEGLSELKDAVPALLNLGTTRPSPNKLLSILEVFFYTIIDRTRDYTPFEELTSQDIDLMVQNFITHFALPDNISLDILNNRFTRAKASLYFPDSQVYQHSNILPTFIFQFLNIQKDQIIPIERFKSLCKYMYNKYLDFVLYQMKKQQESGSIQVEPTMDYLTPLQPFDEEVPGSSRQHHPDADPEMLLSAHTLTGLSQKQQGEKPMDASGKTKKKNKKNKKKKEKKRNKYTKRR